MRCLIIVLKEGKEYGKLLWSFLKALPVWALWAMLTRAVLQPKEEEKQDRKALANKLWYHERFRRRTDLVNLPKPDCNILFIEVTRTLV
jgi:hypothetical protein